MGVAMRLLQRLDVGGVRAVRLNSAQDRRQVALGFLDKADEYLGIDPSRHAESPTSSGVVRWRGGERRIAASTTPPHHHHATLSVIRHLVRLVPTLCLGTSGNY